MKPEIKERVEKIRKGEVPEGYKKTKVGIIPDDWGVIKLKEIGSFSKGKGISKSDVINCGKGCIRYGEIYTSHHIFIKNFKSFISDEDASNSKLISKGDILFAGSGETAEEIGKAVCYMMDDEAYAGGDIIILSPKNKNNYFYGYVLNNDLVNKQTRIKGQGQSVVHIYSKNLELVRIPKPFDYEEKKIVEILSTWDKAIELKEKLIEEKKEFKRGLIQKLLVGKIRFKEYVKNPNLQEVRRYSTLPKDWSIKKASSIFSNISKKNNDNEKLLSATQDNGVIPRDMLDGDVMSPSGDTNSYKLVEEGDFVISLRTFQGGIEYSCYRGIISPAYTVIKNKIPICADFYRYIFKSKLFIDRLASSVIGIRDGKQISYGDFSFMFLPYPELKEQEKIACSLKNLDDNIEFLELELNHLKEQKRGLMQLLLTGIVRVEVD